MKPSKIFQNIGYLFLLITITNCGTNAQTVQAEFFTQTYRNQQFDIVKIDLRKFNVKMASKNEQGKNFGSIKNLKTHVESKGKQLAFAMNGGMYLKDGTPQGLYIENGIAQTPLDTIQKAYGNFYLQPNGIFLLNEENAQVITTTTYRKLKPNPEFATQSGPMLLIDNKVHSAFQEGSKNLHIRNGVGQVSEHEIVFAISKKKVNLYDFAMLFKEALNCENALYLDGFVSRAYFSKLDRKEEGGKFGVIMYVEE